MAVEQSRAGSTKQALGLDSGEKLVVKDVITDPDGTTHVRYNRTYDGLRVIGGDFVSHRAKSGKIKGVNWNGSPEVVVASAKPKLSLSSAQATGSRKASLVQQTTAATKGELVVYSGGASSKAEPKLAYDVLTTGVRADQTPSRVHTIVDANTGATLSTWDEIKNGAGNGIYSGPVTIGTTAGPLWTMRDAAGNHATDLNGATSTSAGTTFTDADDSWGNGAATDRASAGVDAHYGAGKTFDYFKNVLGRNGIWNTGVGARSRVHYGDNYANAFWDGTQLTYGDGAGNTHPLVELDVAGHEMTHGVTENTAGLVGTGEAGGLNEATSDIFGTSVEWYAANAADNPDYLIGELIDVNGDGTPLRYMDRPSRDGVSPDCWSSTLGSLDSHYSSGPLNHWFYLASEGSGAKTVNGVSYNSPTCNASTVTPIGREVAARIWYRTLTTYLTSSNSYEAAREGAIQSAKDLYGAGSAQCLGVAAAFSAIAVPPGAQTCAVASPPPPGSNLLSNPGFESGDTHWSSTADVIAQWGGSGQPARTGTWTAWLGGLGSAHADSISQVVSIPASSSATLSYYAHVDTFETGTTAYDTMTVRVGSTALQTMSNVDAADGYVLKTVNLSAYAGQTVSLSFSGAEDESAATSFVIDDLSLTTPSVAVAPGAPTAVTGTPGNTQAAVSWTAPAGNGGSAITGYTVTATPGGQTATTTGTTSATVTGLANGTAYTFTVTATNTVGTSLVSVASAAVTPRTTPGAPTGVSAVPGNTQAVVSWTAPVSNGGSAITGYTVTAAPGGRTATSTGATSATVTGLANGTAYTFTVTATNVAGTSPATSPSSAVVPRTIPGVPTAVTAAAGNTQAVVSWTAPASDGGSAVIGYTVTAAPGGRTATSTGATSATVTGLANGTAYTFTVTAANAAGTSPVSVASAAVTPRAVPGAPTAVAAVPGDAQAAVSWTAPASDGGSAITGYTVTAAPGGRTATSTGATSATVAGLTNGTAYTFTVTAANAAGTSPVSVASAAVTPRGAPGAPIAVTATPGDTQAAVSWAAPASDGGSAITGYTVTAAPGGQTATTTGATSATVTGLTNGTAYTFRVTATNAVGTSAVSSASAAVTPSTVPGAPVIGTASAANASAVVRWTAPIDSGGALTGYTVRVVNPTTSLQVGTTRPAAAGATSLTVTGLTNGTEYVFQVLATNAVGPGPYSAMSSRVTPVAPVVTAPVTRLSDFNRDGFTDLVARDSTGLLWLYPGNGAGNFKARYQMGSGWNTMTALITPGDVTGDGVADVLARTAAGALWIYPGNGAGGLGARRQIGAGWQSFTVTNAGDMTGDGRGDVLARDASGNLWVYPLAGNAVFQTRRLNSSGWASMTAITGPGDVSGDGRADILGRDGSGLLMLYRGNGTGGLTGGVAARSVLSAGWAGMTALVTPGNWDRAGGNDLLARDAAGALWLYAGDNAGGLAAARSIGSGWNGMTYVG